MELFYLYRLNRERYAIKTYPMKQVLVLTLVMTVLSTLSCTHSVETKNNKSFEWEQFKKENEITVRIEYDNQISGYDVSAICFVDTLNNTDSPQTQNNRNAIVGRAIIHFKNDSTEFIMENPSFTDSILLANTTPLFDGLTKTVQYAPFVPNKEDNMILQGNNTPFFFYDIDMDGEEELIVTVWEGMCYHGHNSYEIYKLNQDTNHLILAPLQQPPFNQINDYTEFDFMNRAITPHEIDAMKIQGDSTYKMR